MLDELKLNLFKAQQAMKQHADKRRREEQFVVGDMVFLKLQPYRQKTLAKRPFEKLSARFYGPFEVLQRIGQVAYKLKLPTTCKVHPVFHVSQLRRAVGTQEVSPSIPEQLTSELELVVEPEKLLEVRSTARGQERMLEVLIKWKHLPPFEATWEEAAEIHERFPDFHS